MAWRYAPTLRRLPRPASRWKLWLPLLPQPSRSTTCAKPSIKASKSRTCFSWKRPGARVAIFAGTLFVGGGRAESEEGLGSLVDGVEDFIAKPFLVKDLVRITKKVIDRLHLEKLQKRASRPGVIQGRLEEMSMIDLMQSLEMGQKSCRLIVHHNGEQGELYFSSGQCRDAKSRNM